MTLKKLPEGHPQLFGKYHQKTRLETILKDCWKCHRETVWIYKGDYRTKINPQHTYECMGCGIHYTNQKKLK